MMRVIKDCFITPIILGFLFFSSALFSATFTISPNGPLPTSVPKEGMVAALFTVKKTTNQI